MKERLLPSAKVTVSRLTQSRMALSPMEVTAAGMVICVKASHPLKALEPILVMPAERSIFSSTLQLVKAASGTPVRAQFSPICAFCRARQS